MIVPCDWSAPSLAALVRVLLLIHQIHVRPSLSGYTRSFLIVELFQTGKGSLRVEQGDLQSPAWGKKTTALTVSYQQRAAANNYLSHFKIRLRTFCKKLDLHRAADHRLKHYFHVYSAFSHILHFCSNFILFYVNAK